MRNGPQDKNEHLKRIKDEDSNVIDLPLNFKFKLTRPNRNWHDAMMNHVKK
jgi:hypothetical protein